MLVILSLERSDFLINLWSPLFHLNYHIFAVVKNNWLLLELFPREVVHFFDAFPVHLNPVLKLLYPGLNLFVNGLEFGLDILL